MDKFSQGDDMVVMAGAGTGKALRDDQAVMTPYGPRPIGSLRSGDLVLGTAGTAIPVTAVYPQGIRPLFQVTTCDGVEIIADAEHLWTVIIYDPSHSAHIQDPERHQVITDSRVTMKTVNTTELTRMLDSGCLVRLPVMTAPARFSGDTSTGVFIGFPTAEEPDLDDKTVEGVADICFASVTSRYRLLCSLLNTSHDGFIRVGNRRLADTVAFVARSLGGTADLRSSRSEGDGYVVKVRLPERTPNGIDRPVRRITGIAPVQPGPATCITVDSPDRLYVTEGFVLTHNTSTLSLLGETLYRDDPHARGFYVALNKSVAKEVGTKFSRGNVECSTIHSLAFRASLNIPHIKPLLDRLNSKSSLKPGQLAAHFKVGNLNVDYTPPEELKKDKSNSDPVTVPTRDLCSAAVKMVRTWCSSAESAMSADHLDDVKGMPDHVFFGKYSDAVMKLARRMWDEDITRPDGQIRYEHSFYLKSWALTGPDIVKEFGLQNRRVVFFFDEAQDSAPVMSDIVLRQRGSVQLVLVGDSSQAIYQWTGAIDSLAKFRQWSNVTQTRLTRTWRFGPAIAALANSVLDRINGDVRIVPNPAVLSRVQTVSPPEQYEVIPEYEDIPTALDAAITRSNAELIRLLLCYLDMGLKVYCYADTEYIIRISEDIDRLKAGKIPWNQDMKFWDSYEAMKQDIAHPDKSDADDQLLRLVNSLVKIGSAKVRSCLSKVVPSEQAADVVLSTIHKAKGREWPRVWLVSGPRMMLLGNGPVEERWMLVYVAVTRGIDTLYLDADMYRAIVGEGATSRDIGFYTSDPALMRLGPLFPKASREELLELAASPELTVLTESDLIDLAINASEILAAVTEHVKDKQPIYKVKPIEVALAVGPAVILEVAAQRGTMPLPWVLTRLAGVVNPSVHPHVAEYLQHAARESFSG